MEDIWVFPKIGGKPPKWMVYFMENPIKMDDLGCFPPIFGNTHFIFESFCLFEVVIFYGFDPMGFITIFSPPFGSNMCYFFQPPKKQANLRFFLQSGQIEHGTLGTFPMVDFSPLCSTTYQQHVINQRVFQAKSLATPGGVP